MHTLNTINTELSKERIHIAPVGFEDDRVVLPAIKFRADRVWLLKEENTAEEKATEFIKQIQNSLKKKQN